jgi:SPP1 gp7 family putative phage head morphogenesis protein
VSVLNRILIAIAERAKSPGILSLVGIRRENSCRRDLKKYFDALWLEIKQLSLEDLAGKANLEVTLHSSELRLRRAIRTVQPTLIGTLSSQIYLAMLEGAKQTKITIPAKEAAGDTGTQGSTPPPVTGFGLDPTLSLTDQLGSTGLDAANYAAQRAAHLVIGLDATTLSTMQGLIEQGITEQLGTAGLGRLIRTGFQDMSVYRSQMIATTEMNDAFSQAAVKKMQSFGVEYMRWITAPGCCDECEDNDDEIVAIGDLFPTGDERPPVHPNCRCAVVPSRGPDDSTDSQD